MVDYYLERTDTALDADAIWILIRIPLVEIVLMCILSTGLEHKHILEIDELIETWSLTIADRVTGLGGTIGRKAGGLTTELCFGFADGEVFAA